MTRKMIAAGALMLLISLPLGAQERPTVEVRSRQGEPTRVWVNGQDVSDRFAPLLQRRARLGVTVNLEARDSDARGAYLTAVTPGGPADKAGLRAGDVITRLDGQALVVQGAKAAESESAPGLRLIELAAKLEPNDTIPVEYLRGDARRTTSLVTGDDRILITEGEGNLFRFRMPDREFAWSMPGLRLEREGPGGEEGLLRRRIEVAPRVEFRREGPGGVVMAFGGSSLWDLELAPITEDLGWYFGTSEGTLVIKAPASSSLGLKAGDVILSVDGRKPSSPSSLLRILRSYEQGESFKLEIMRQKRRETITGKVDPRDFE